MVELFQKLKAWRKTSPPHQALPPVKEGTAFSVRWPGVSLEEVTEKALDYLRWMDFEQAGCEVKLVVAGRNNRIPQMPKIAAEQDDPVTHGQYSTRWTITASPKKVREAFRQAFRLRQKLDQKTSFSPAAKA